MIQLALLLGAWQLHDTNKRAASCYCSTAIRLRTSRARDSNSHEPAGRRQAAQLLEMIGAAGLDKSLGQDVKSIMVNPARRMR